VKTRLSEIKGLLHEGSISRERDQNTLFTSQARCWPLTSQEKRSQDGPGLPASRTMGNRCLFFDPQSVVPGSGNPSSPRQAIWQMAVSLNVAKRGFPGFTSPEDPELFIFGKHRSTGRIFLGLPFLFSGKTRFQSCFPSAKSDYQVHSVNMPTST
jgi:hypothetical protein